MASAPEAGTLAALVPLMYRADWAAVSHLRDGQVVHEGCDGVTGWLIPRPRPVRPAAPAWPGWSGTRLLPGPSWTISSSRPGCSAGSAWS